METNQRFVMDGDRILMARGRSVSAYRLKRVASDIDLQKCRCQCTCGQSMFSSMSNSMTDIQRDAEGSNQPLCRLHRRSALRRVHTLTGEPSSPRTGRSNRQRSPSTPNAPDPKMLQRGLDPGGGGKDLSKFSLMIELDDSKETIRLPAVKDRDLKDVLEETLRKKGLTLDDIEIFINNTNSNPLPKNDKGLKVPTEPLGGLEVFIKPAKEKTPGPETCPVTATKKKKDLSAFLGVKDDVSTKVGPRDRRMSVPAIVSVG